MLLLALIFLFVIILLGLLMPTLFFLWISAFRSRSTTNSASLKRSAAVVVLGDIGRSPRMCYHVESLAHEGWKVGIVGYAGVELPLQLHRATIKRHTLPSPPTWISSLPKAAFIAVAPFKVLWQTFSLFWALSVSINPPPEVILVQTPPALPTIFVVRFVSLLLRSRVIIDWHNLGYTILALRLSPSHPLVRLAAWLERMTGRSAFAHLFVTKAMMLHLSRQWGLRGRMRVLHDRPPDHFRRATIRETHELFCRLVGRLNAPMAGAVKSRKDGSSSHSTSFSAATSAMQVFWPSFSMPDSTPFTKRIYHDELDKYVDGTAEVDWSSKRTQELRRRGSGVSIEIDGSSPASPSLLIGPCIARPSRMWSSDTQQQQQLSPLSSTSPHHRSHSPPRAPSCPPRRIADGNEYTDSMPVRSGRSSLNFLQAGMRIAGRDDVGFEDEGASEWCWRSDRPALAVSSTSWTADEDFSILLLAASMYERRARDLHNQVCKDNKNGDGAGNGTVEALSKDSSPLPHPSWDSQHSSFGSPLLPSSEIESGANARHRHGSARSRRPRSGSFERRLPASPTSHGPFDSIGSVGDRKLPKLLIIVTGKGELRAHYEEQIEKLEREMNWQWVRIRTAWLQSEEYPILLGSADIGISLHSSSSGLDLPMKVVDMLGCSLPVLALDFPCLNELVIDGLNGLTFSDASGLARGLENVLSGFPDHDNRLRRNLEEQSAFPTEEDSIPGVAGRIEDNEDDLDEAGDETSQMLFNAGFGNHFRPNPASREASIPLSPALASFSRLTSPTLPSFFMSTLDESHPFRAVASAHLGKGQVHQESSSTARVKKRDRNATWRGNWKRVVLPLLLLEEHEEDAKKKTSRPGKSGLLLWVTPQGKHDKLRALLNHGEAPKTRTSEESIRNPFLLAKEPEQRKEGLGGHVPNAAISAVRHGADSADRSHQPFPKHGRHRTGSLRRRKKSEFDGFGTALDQRAQVGIDKEGDVSAIPHIRVSGTESLGE
ncbi:glycosyltransferase family 33 protein [Tilletiaria anomala UBC 951]|uniref:Chitobiosyldiphosphodolichol beta-mannosyltransferase n=1 Tax=Tilletiaria anomala (strain ATCC 24038 / CBS 436.72 / UBC 951) TaxID=1037660 RepID=A0A066WHQ4_TILAU|nr:glycosyltransferase family 33 protein [Tilletiaria anomala UBC 951]KDN52053.1 glycosyltransferase family 33 protein [Tilletiaria anomala UBC 951]